MIEIIDAVVNLRTPEIIQSFPNVWGQQSVGAREALKMDVASFKGMPVEEVVSQMDEAGVQKALLHASDSGRSGVRVSPEAVNQAIKKYPDRLVAGAIGVNIYRGMQAVRELTWYVQEYGFKALHLFPHWLERPASDPIYYPFYSKCVELGIPVCMQIRIPFQRSLRSYGHPKYVEQVAVNFPELRIVGLHLALPWLDEYMELLTMFPNLYMTTSVHPTSDWEVKFNNFVNTIGQDQIIFGSASPYVKGGIKEAVNGIKGQKLDETVNIKILSANATRVFNL